ncbi:pyruvate, phosphate dikinase [Rhodococcus rhodochrous]|uniref:pyruvate, phosphate dikinase n=1 Tax=Rhodococcus rhodochrous TaxID=1829 RepID=UPI001E485901|nr:pyruvate, phosphate dikinase [Rhodococcus rhodochrous]MCB8913101.1 pyruvate, phosphate dikinase [Rhodococcus rhodochrous]
MSAATATSGLTRAFNEPGAIDRNVLGGKGYGLVEMTQEGLNVPGGYVISTAACHHYLKHGSMTTDLVEEIHSRLGELEGSTGKTFGAGPVPLLLSVRSGAPVSMPGMMDTVLNLGLSRDAAIALAMATGDTRFMADVLFRFHGMYAETVMGALETPDRDELTALLDGVKASTEPGPVYDRVWEHCQSLLRDELDDEVPSDPYAQLIGAVEAVFRSWNTRRAVKYREIHKIPDDLGTAVVVQSMVFGNLDEQSGSGVVFTRNPVTGEPGLFGEFLAASQGEDVVAGIRTPDPVVTLRDRLPEVYAELESTCAELERRRGDVLDIEFTVERGILYMLQVRSAKRTAQAAIRIAADLLAEDVVTDAEALSALTLEQIRQVQRPGFDPAAYTRARNDGRVLATGVGAAPGNVVGQLFFDSDAAQQAAKNGKTVILARPVTSPTDLHGMIAAAGILTATGGSTSHAAVVARALGTTCVVGCGAVDIDPDAGTMKVDGITLTTGDVVSLDGSTGEVILGEIELSEPAAEDDRLATLLLLARDRAGTQVFARATTTEQVQHIHARGAAGVVAGIDDVLATSGHLDEIITLLQEGEIRDATAVLEEAVATEFVKLFTDAPAGEFGVRAIDFHADESSELLRATELFVTHPELALPLGSEEMVAAQLRGIARAAAEAQSDLRVHFTVRKIASAQEIAALVTLRDSLPDAQAIEIGSYLTSPRGVASIEAMAELSDVVWIELRVLQAAVTGIPPRHLLTSEPLDSYLRRGLMEVDPRVEIDDQVGQLIDGVAAELRSARGCRIGVRLTGPVSAELLQSLQDRGFDRIGVDGDEVRPTLLALGQRNRS